MSDTKKHYKGIVWFEKALTMPIPVYASSKEEAEKKIMDTFNRQSKKWEKVSGFPYKLIRIDLDE